MTRRPVMALAASLPALPESQRLAGRLLAVLRPLFAAEVIVPGPADVVLAGQRCTVPGCGRRCQGRGLCGSHYSRWHKSGKPDLTEFTGATGPVVRAWRGLRAAEGYDLCGLPPQLRLERRGPPPQDRPGRPAHGTGDRRAHRGRARHQRRPARYVLNRQGPAPLSRRGHEVACGGPVLTHQQQG